MIPYHASNHKSQTTLSSLDLGKHLDTVRYRVIQILKQFPECRNSDKLLLFRYYKEFEGIDTKLNIVDAAMESITRARRKVQELNEELAAAPEFKQARAEKREQYRQHYSRGDPGCA